MLNTLTCRYMYSNNIIGQSVDAWKLMQITMADITTHPTFLKLIKISLKT